MAGYSAKPLAHKLGIKPGMCAAVLGAPDGFLDSIGNGLSLEVLEVAGDLAATDYDYLHLFVREEDLLAARLPVLRAALRDAGMLWVSWPKRASRVPTNVSGNVVRTMALAQQLVDIKVCAIDPVWSGLKLVIPVALRGRA